MGKNGIKIAFAGVGNCCCALIQGFFYYKDVSKGKSVPGLMHNDIGGYEIRDITPVAAFDVDKRKVGLDLGEAIFAKPNCTRIFCADVPKLGVVVQKAPVLDGVAAHMSDYPSDSTFEVDERTTPVDVSKVLKETNPDILINYVPVGSEEAARYYAKCCLETGVAMINCMPVFIASDPVWAKKFEDARIPIVGDDVKSQVGATIVHRVLTKLFSDRGVKLDRTYQLNVGGDTDFLNMLARERLKSKKLSKTRSVQSQLPEPLPAENIHIGPSDYIPWLKNNKVCFIRMEGRKFGDIPIELELRLSVEDSPNSAGSVIDAIRCCKLAMDRKIGGPLTSISAYTMKHPLEQFSDPVAREMVEQFIKGERER